MTHTDEARTQVLQHVRSALDSTSDLAAARRTWAQLERPYQATADASREELVALLTERLCDYDAQVQHVARREIAYVVERILAQNTADGKGARLLAPPGLAADMLPQNADWSFDQDFSAPELDGFDCVLTQATLAIAETGTLVLQSVPGQGRRAATLVSDTHLCVVETGTIVRTVPEAIRALQSTATLPTTFISGPSATADIEMTRIKGVHGPRFLHVLLVTE